MNYSTTNAVRREKSENNFDDIDLSGSGEEATVEEILAALDTIPDAEGLSQKVTETLSPAPKVLSKKVTTRPRSSDRQDKLILRKIQLFQLPGTSPNQLPLVGAPHTLNPPANDNRLPVWKFGEDRLKLAMACEALELLEGEGRRPFSWSLNLSFDRENEALRDPKAFTRHMQRQIDRDLVRAGFDRLPWWFSVDVEGDRLHLHGGMLLADEDVPKVDAALRRAGGKMTGIAAKYQLDMKPRCDHGWATYAIRNRGRVRPVIGDHTVSISQPLRSQARWLYERYREIMREAR